MLNETFYIDGVDARNFGIYLQRPIEFSEARPVVEIQSIPGRNGDLVFETGSYENRTGIASCFCLQKDVEKAISAAGGFLMSKHGYRRLETSDDPDHFWLARIENSPSIAQRMRTLAPFEISFDCKPQRFLKSGEEIIRIDGSGGFHGIYNFSQFEARPLIHIKCKSVPKEKAQYVSVNVSERYSGNRKSILLKLYDDSDYYIDFEMHSVYNEAGNQYKHFARGDFWSFYPGDNEFNVTATAAGDYDEVDEFVEFVEIIPRWWEL